MKLIRIVRSEGGKDIIKFMKLSKHCPQKELTSAIQYIFGNPSTIGCSQVLCDTSGKKVTFENLENTGTYFITFEKKEIKSLLNWEAPYSDFVSHTNSTNLQILDESEYLTSKINETKSVVTDKATELILKQEDSFLTLKQSLSKIHNTLGSSSLKVIEYSANTAAILNKARYLIPLLQQSIQELRQTNDELRTVYAYKAPLEVTNRGKKTFLDPRIMNYMKQFSYKDMPVNELTPGEMKRFMKFQMIMENQITNSSSQNTPSAKRSKKMQKLNIGSPFSKHK